MAFQVKTSVCASFTDAFAISWSPFLLQGPLDVSDQIAGTVPTPQYQSIFLTVASAAHVIDTIFAADRKISVEDGYRVRNDVCAGVLDIHRERDHYFVHLRSHREIERGVEICLGWGDAHRMDAINAMIDVYPNYVHLHKIGLQTTLERLETMSPRNDWSRITSPDALIRSLFSYLGFQGSQSDIRIHEMVDKSKGVLAFTEDDVSVTIETLRDEAGRVMDRRISITVEAKTDCNVTHIPSVWGKLWNAFRDSLSVTPPA